MVIFTVSSHVNLTKFDLLDPHNLSSVDPPQKKRSGEKKIGCSTIDSPRDMIFLNLQNITISASDCHMRQHTGEKPFSTGSVQVLLPSLILPILSLFSVNLPHENYEHEKFGQSTIDSFLDMIFLKSGKYHILSIFFTLFLNT